MFISRPFAGQSTRRIKFAAISLIALVMLLGQACEAIAQPTAGAKPEWLEGRWVGKAYIQGAPKAPPYTWDLSISHNAQGWIIRGAEEFSYNSADSKSTKAKLEGAKLSVDYNTDADGQKILFRMVVESSGDRLSGYESCEQDGKEVWRKLFNLDRKGKMASDMDPFWRWYVEFQRILNAQQGKIKEIRSQAALLGLHVLNERQEVARFQAAMKDAGELVTPDVRIRVRDGLAHHQDELRLGLAKLESDAFEARLAMEAITSFLEKGFSEHGEKHLSNFVLWKKVYGDQATELPFDLAMVAADRQRLADLVKNSRTQSLSPEFRLRHAAGLLSLGEVGQTILECREILHADANNPAAKRLLAKAESIVLQRSMAKAEGVRAEARAAFEAYLDATGHGAKSGKPRPAWARILLGPIDQTNQHMLKTAVLNDPVNVMGRLAGRLEGEEIRLDSVQREMTQAFLAMQVMLHLSRDGKTLQEIEHMDSKALAEALALKHVTGEPYSEEEFRAVGSAIHAVLSRNGLDDLAALLDEKRDLPKPLDQPSLKRDDVANTYWDEFGSEYMSQAILFFLPFGKVSTGGKMLFECVADVEARILQWDRVAAWFASNERDRWILQGFAQFARLERYLVDQGKTAALYALKGTEFVALVVIQHETLAAAEKYGGPYAKLVVEALLLMPLAHDTGMLRTFIEEQNFTLERTAQVVERNLKESETAIKSIEAATKRREIVRGIPAAREGGQTLTPEQSQAANESTSLDESSFVPDGEPANDIRLPARQEAIDKLDGKESPATAAVRELEADAEAQAARVKASQERVKALRERIRADMARAQARMLPPKYKAKPMNPWYRGEELGKSAKVRYMEAAERDACELVVRDGKVYKRDGTLFDTSGSKTASKEGRAIYIMDEAGRIYASEAHVAEGIHHSSMLRGQPVAAAGEFEVQQGVIKSVNRRSGHYSPTDDFLDQFMEELQSRGIDISKIKKLGIKE